MGGSSKPKPPPPPPPPPPPVEAPEVTQVRAGDARNRRKRGAASTILTGGGRGGLG